jgi:hypothetical protein
LVCETRTKAKRRSERKRRRIEKNEKEGHKKIKTIFFP